MTPEAARWYAKEAAHRLGWSEEDIVALGKEMYLLQDIYTEQEADDAYRGKLPRPSQRSEVSR